MPQGLRTRASCTRAEKRRNILALGPTRVTCVLSSLASVSLHAHIDGQGRGAQGDLLHFRHITDTADIRLEGRLQATRASGACDAYLRTLFDGWVMIFPTMRLSCTHTCRLSMKPTNLLYIRPNGLHRIRSSVDEICVQTRMHSSETCLASSTISCCAICSPTQCDEVDDLL